MALEGRELWTRTAYLPSRGKIEEERVQRAQQNGRASGGRSVNQPEQASDVTPGIDHL
jgi:hypothetical protein